MEPIYLPRGFTLVELLVVLAIIGTIMSVVFTNQGSFNKSFVLTNTAYDVALSLRNAETFGLGSRALGSTANAGYGLHFQNGSPSTFSFFADISPATSCATPDCKPGDNVYTTNDGQPIRTYTLGNGITITDFCALGTSWTCTYAHDGYSAGLTSLDIVFARPNPTPLISGNGVYSASSPLTAACITLSSGLGTKKYVSISLAGEISPVATSCP